MYPERSSDETASTPACGQRALKPRRKPSIEHTTRGGRPLVNDIQYRRRQHPALRPGTKELNLSEIGRLAPHILIDEATGVTVGAGMINSAS